MTLIRFLAVGRSLGAIDNAPSRYRMNAQGMLPKFGREETAQAQPAATPPSVAQPETSKEKTSLHKKPMTVKPQQRPKFWNRGWFSFGLSSRRRRGTRAAGPPIQAELGLDMVRPVRNDLSESDFEIVTPPKSKAAPAVVGRGVPAEPPLTGDGSPYPVQQSNAGARLSWGRVRGRLFGARQT
jgi:hypothetical protein